MPLMPNANEPSALPAPKGTRSVTKYSPTGVGEYEAPVAPGARNKTLPNFRTITMCCDRSTSTRTRVVSRERPLSPDPALAPGPRVGELDASPAPVGRDDPRPTRRSGCRSTWTPPGRPRPEPRPPGDGRTREAYEARGRARWSSGRRARPRTAIRAGSGRTPDAGGAKPCGRGLATITRVDSRTERLGGACLRPDHVRRHRGEQPDGEREHDREPRRGAGGAACPPIGGSRGST